MIGARIRIVALVVALAATGCGWPMVGHDAGHSFFSPADATITPADVGGLHELWHTTGSQVSAPIAADGRVFTVQAGADGGDLAAYAAPGCGAAACAPTWTRPAAGTPLLVNGHVNAGTDFTFLPPGCSMSFCAAVGYRGGAFDPATGAPAPGGVQTAIQYPVVSDGVLYDWTLYTTQLHPPAPAALWGLNETKLDGGGTTRRLDQFLSPRPLAVADGSVYLFQGDHVEAYMKDTPNGCGMFLGCHPTWTATLAHATGWDGLVTVAHGLLYISDLAGGVEVFDAHGCGLDACPPLWTAAAGGVHVGQVAVTGTTLFAPSDDGHLYAFPATGCGTATCAPSWSADLGSAVHAPSVAGSVVYAGTEDGRLVAFDAVGCGATTCTPLRSVTVGAAVRVPVTISDGRVFVADGAGTLRAFGLT